jgi:Leucine-rich repeat (LRR) protein
MEKVFKTAVIFMIVFISTSNIMAKTNEQDSLALVALYNATDGEHWTNNTNWLSSNNVSTWHGVSLKSDLVLTIDLANNNLSGSLPQEIGDINALWHLLLSGNNLSGTIPAELSNSSNLSELDLHSNQLSGTIPTEFTALSSIETINLSDNNFDELPDLSSLSKITELKLEENGFTFEDLETNAGITGISYSPQDSVCETIDTTMLTHCSFRAVADIGGTANIYQWKKDGAVIEGAVDSIFEISSLTEADSGIYICEISNSIVSGLTIYRHPIKLRVNKATPAQIDSLALVALYDSTDGANWTDNTNWLSDSTISTWKGITIGDSGRVTEIYLRQNKLDGTIPKEVWDITQLREINLSNNKLSGTIPKEIGNLINLKKLNLSGNNLSGNIPIEIDKLVKLTNLSLFKNKLSGNIPAEIGNMIKLRSLGMSDNEFVGSIPTEIGNLVNLYNLNLSKNQLTGVLPVELCNLTKLGYLILNSNQLSGNIPHEIGNLTNMGYFYIHENQFDGTIPAEIGNWVKVRNLMLNKNQLSGNIPQEITNLSLMMDLNISDNQLTGSVPDSITKLINLKTLNLSQNDLDGLPDLSSLPKIEKLYIENNKLTFEDLEANVGIANKKFSPQDSIGNAIDTTISSGSTFNAIVEVGGTANIYQWYKDGSAIVGADSNIYTIGSLALSDAGSYSCVITNSIVTDLTLNSRPINLHVVVATSTQNEASLPIKYALEQNYPNPFNPSTMIKYALPEMAKVKIAIYDIRGRQVALLLNSEEDAGYHSLKFDASALSAGMYFYEIRSNNFRQIKKMMLIK